MSSSNRVQLSIEMLWPRYALCKEMLLAPFLTTTDLLHLSEAAKWLEPYRHQLPNIKFSCKVRSQPLAKSGVLELVRSQRRLESLVLHQQDPGQDVMLPLWLAQLP